MEHVPRTIRRATVAGLAAIAVLLAPAPSSADGIQVELAPTSVVVDPEEVFDLEITVPAPDDSFNAYETTITYDPSKLTFIQLAPVSQQEGPLMTTACATRWHSFSESGGTIELTHALLCAGVKVAGPGVTYRLRFQAGTIETSTTVGFQAVDFADAGIRVLPITSTDAVVQIGSATSVPGDDTGARTPLRSPSPNPFGSATHVGFALAEEGRARLEVYSVRGRRLRTLLDEVVPAGVERTLRWDGRDDAGHEVPAGVYFLRLTTPAGADTRRMVKRR